MQKDIDPDYLASQGLSATFPERFWSKVFITPTHWLWEGNRRMPAGHGSIWKGVKNDRGNYRGLIYAHVASWIINVGPIPQGKLVLHNCPGRHLTWCVNPDHLYLGSFKDNSQDSIKNRTHWFSNNPKAFSGENSPQRKLSLIQVNEIRKSYQRKELNQVQLAAKFGVTQAAIWYIIHRVNWK